MIKSYIIPQLSAIQIDSEISLRLTTILEDPESNLVLEPGTGGGGLGGVSNGSNESGWGDRAGLDSPEPKDPFGSNIWK